MTASLPSDPPASQARRRDHLDAPAKSLAATGVDVRPLAEVVRRYLHAYGPATPAQFAQWLAAPRRWATELFGSLAGDLQQVDLNGAPASLAAGDTAMPSAAPRGLRLLPYFDAYLVACQPRELVFPGRAGGRALTPNGQAGNFPVLLIDGIAGGVWHQRRSGRKVAITVEPFEPLTAQQRRELDAQVQRIGEFLAATPPADHRPGASWRTRMIPVYGYRRGGPRTIDGLVPIHPQW